MLDESVIPKGIYCYSYDENDKIIMCPYWRCIKERDGQENGWCDYLGMGDKEIIAEGGYQLVIKNEKFGNFGFSFLWDQCKMCNINNDDI
jgi:hypothetical protein